MNRRILTRTLATAALTLAVSGGAVAAQAHADDPFGNPSKDVEEPGFGIGSHAGWLSNPVGSQEECIRDQQLLAGDGAQTTTCRYEAGAWTFYWRYTF